MKNDLSLKEYKRYYTYIAPIFRGKRVRNYTYIILTFLTSAFFAYAAIKPTIKSIVSLQKQIIDLKLTNTKLEEKIKALSKGQEIISSLGADLPLIDEGLPTKPNLNLLVKQLENLVASSNVTFYSLAFNETTLRKNNLPQTISPKTALKEVAFNFSINGKYENLINFLEKSRQIRRVLVLEDIQITKNKIKDENSILTLSARAKAFYRD